MSDRTWSIGELAEESLPRYGPSASMRTAAARPERQGTTRIFHHRDRVRLQLTSVASGSGSPSRDRSRDQHV